MVDDLFYLLLGISMFFFALIVGLMVVFVIRVPPPARPSSVAVAEPQHGPGVDLDA